MQEDKRSFEVRAHDPVEVEKSKKIVRQMLKDLDADKPTFFERLERAWEAFWAD
ncbi:hypothetical protein [Levilactobacillus cerevisiae]|uniref:hypothetical protein n=1 Tax=Levilactobacillus cerevisiae TaxID=1704076 RepID=UPI0013DDF580|nr:hypothetical protein [Levilactobacillus cerevisiae]